MAEIRNLIIGLDGTWNDPDESPPTNVAKLLRACSARNQEQHYEEGVGTAHWEALPGGIYGAGLDRLILGAYRFLWRRFSAKGWDEDTNRVFIFGFSRGAYAARRLAGLVDFCGVPQKATDVQRAWEIYLARDRETAAMWKEEGRLFDIPVEMVGVWDTVKTTNDRDFNDHQLPACVVKGYHAIAIDERRRLFPALEWEEDGRVHQTWFAGVHSDVGGGYEDPSLSDIALQWMIDRACEHGLRVKASAVGNLKPEPSGELHESFEGIWEPFGARVRPIADQARIHGSVQERRERVADYRPANLPGEPIFEA